MITDALAKIEAELRELAQQAENEPVDSYRLNVLARQVAAQRDMIEQGLVG